MTTNDHVQSLDIVTIAHTYISAKCIHSYSDGVTALNGQHLLASKYISNHIFTSNGFCWQTRIVLFVSFSSILKIA